MMLGANPVYHSFNGGVEDLDDHHQPADDDKQQDLVERIPQPEGKWHQQQDQHQLLPKRRLVNPG